MKIIFLDVDGVLNHGLCPEWVTGDPHVLANECIEQILRITAATGAKIVLSSTWRLSEDGCKTLANHWLDNGMKSFTDDFIGKTPCLNFHGPRRAEILDWLQTVWPLSYGWNGEVVTHMAVLDDDTDADLGDGSFFKTDFESGGLTKEVADRVIAHLSV